MFLKLHANSNNITHVQLITLLLAGNVVATLAPNADVPNPPFDIVNANDGLIYETSATFDSVHVLTDANLSAINSGLVSPNTAFKFKISASIDGNLFEPVSVTQAFSDAGLGAIIAVSSESITAQFNRQTTIDANYTVEQRAIIATLTVAQQVTLAYGTTAQKTAVISSLTNEQQLVFGVLYAQTDAQIAADKLRFEDIVFRLKNGEFISDDDSVFYALGNSLMATAAMGEIDAGRGYNGLRNIGLTQAQALKVLSIYNVVLETAKYESEVKLAALESSPVSIGSLETYLAGLTPPLTLPPITQYLAALRADTAIYTAIRNWTP